MDAPAQPVTGVGRGGPGRGASALLLLVVGLVVMEVTCRIEDWVIYRTPIASRASSVSDLVVKDSDGQHGRASIAFQKWKMNSLGMRGPEVPAIASPNTIRIVTVGASETFGQRESPNREFPRQLEDSLGARASHGACGGGVQFQVLNAAFAGMALPTIAQDVSTRIKRLAPAIVVVYATPAQYLNYEPPVPAARARPGEVDELPLSRVLLPRTFNRLREQLKTLIPARLATWLRSKDIAMAVADHPAGWRFESPPLDRLAQYERDLRGVVGLIRGNGSVPVIATHANVFRGRDHVDEDMLLSWVRFYPRATGPVILQFDSLANDVTRRVGADSSVVTVDASGVMAGAPKAAFGDFVHFTDLGSARMASAFADGVLLAARSAGKCLPGGQP